MEPTETNMGRRCRNGRQQAKGAAWMRKMELLHEYPHETVALIMNSGAPHQMPRVLLQYSFRDIYDIPQHKYAHGLLQDKPELVRALFRHDVECLRRTTGVTKRKVRSYFHRKYGVVAKALKSLLEAKSLASALGVDTENPEGPAPEMAPRARKRARQQKQKGLPGSSTDKPEMPLIAAESSEEGTKPEPLQKRCGREQTPQNTEDCLMDSPRDRYLQGAV